MTDTGLKALIEPRSCGGCVLSIAFNLRDRSGSIELDVFVNAYGYLAGIDVACNANSEPMPDDPQLLDFPYHIHGPLAKESASE